MIRRTKRMEIQVTGNFKKMSYPYECYCKLIADRLNLSGYVRNTRSLEGNDALEISVVGEENQIEKFYQLIRMTDVNPVPKKLQTVSSFSRRVEDEEFDVRINYKEWLTSL